MNPAQSRMARSALKFGIRDVAKAAHLAPSIISRFEAGKKLNPRMVEAIQRAYETAGVEFTDGNEPGVRIKK
jgi:transcriptional regulator with XRE-family HTH domain